MKILNKIFWKLMNFFILITLVIHLEYYNTFITVSI